MERRRAGLSTWQETLIIVGLGVLVGILLGLVGGVNGKERGRVTGGGYPVAEIISDDVWVDRMDRHLTATVEQNYRISRQKKSPPR